MAGMTSVMLSLFKDWIWSGLLGRSRRIASYSWGAKSKKDRAWRGEPLIQREGCGGESQDERQKVKKNNRKGQTTKPKE